MGSKDGGRSTSDGACTRHGECKLGKPHAEFSAIDAFKVKSNCFSVHKGLSVGIYENV